MPGWLGKNKTDKKLFFHRKKIRVVEIFELFWGVGSDPLMWSDTEKISSEFFLSQSHSEKMAQAQDFFSRCHKKSFNEIALVALKCDFWKL